MIFWLFIAGMVGFLVCSICSVSGYSDEYDRGYQDGLNRNRARKVEEVTEHIDHRKGRCPACGLKVWDYGDTNYCLHCGQRLEWEYERIP